MSDRASDQQHPPFLPGLWTLLRDVLTFFGGWIIVFMEVSRPEVRESVLVLAGSVIGVPGLAVGASSVAEAIRRRTGTGGSPSGPVDSPSSPSS